MKVGGTIIPPGDKSITHRALLLAGMAQAQVSIGGALTGADARSTARVLRQLGVDVAPLRKGATVRITGTQWQNPSATLNCGNSGTTVRLLIGALAGTRLRVRLDGDKSLRRRPMRRVTEPLTAMGATIEEERGDGLPLTVRGGVLSPIQYHSPVASAQLKSALLFAGLVGGVPVSVVEPFRSRDHTERMLRYLGVDIRSDGTTVELVGSGSVWPITGPWEINVPGDPSSAAFLVAVALLADGGELLIRNVCSNPTRTGFVDVLRRMGANITLENESESGGENVADFCVRPADLCGTAVTASEIPGLIDEIPVLAIVAARATGETVFRSVGELRHKESNRLDLIVENLRRIGGIAEVCGDDLHIVGTDTPLCGRVDTGGDHRMSMAFSVLGMVRQANLEISDTASSGVSYPNFFDDLRAVGGHE